MSIERVRGFFAQYGMEDRILEFPVSSATVELAAQALHTEGKRIAKSLSFSVDGAPMLVVLAGDAKIKAQFHQKASMLPPDRVESEIGHAVGGVCPFAVNAGVKVYLDVSLKRFDTVFPACGSANSAIELRLEELERFSGASAWVDVGKLPTDESV